MIDQAQLDRITTVLPVLKLDEPRLVREFAQAAWIARIPVGHDVFVEGDRVDAIALLISGVVRVYKIGETGREITLYRFGLGESCILTANAILSQQSFPAIATVEQEAEAVMIPADVFRDWVRRYDLWRGFVFDLLSQRLASVMALVDEVVFRRLDTRIASILLDRSQVQNPIHITHQEIAAELGVHARWSAGYWKTSPVGELFARRAAQSKSWIASCCKPGSLGDFGHRQGADRPLYWLQYQNLLPKETLT